MLLKEYIKIVMKEILNEESISGDQEVLSLFKRILHNIGTEEVSWFVRDKKWTELIQQMLEMLEYGFPNKPRKYLELVAKKDYVSLCKLIQFSLEGLTGANIPCSPKIIEHFFYSRKNRGV